MDEWTEPAGCGGSSMAMHTLYIFSYFSRAVQGCPPMRVRLAGE